MTAIPKGTLEHDELDEEYIELYASRESINYPIYRQTLYNCSISAPLWWNLGYNVQFLFVVMRIPIGNESAEHIIRPAKVIPACQTATHCT